MPGAGRMLFGQGYDAMTIFSIAHIDQAAELVIDAPAGGATLVLRVDAPGNEFPLSAAETDLLSDALLFWIIGDTHQRAALVVEH